MGTIISIRSLERLLSPLNGHDNFYSFPWEVPLSSQWARLFLFVPLEAALSSQWARLFLFVPLGGCLSSQWARLFLFVPLGLSPFLSKGTIISIRSLGGCSFLSKGTIISIRSLGRLLSPLNGHDYFYSFPWEAALSSQWARLFLFVPLKGCSLLSMGTIISIRSLWRLLSPLNGHDYFYSFPWEAALSSQWARLFLFVPLGLSPFLSKGTIISIRSLGGCSFLSKGTIISIRSLGRLLSPLNGHDYFYSFPREAPLSSQWARLFLFVPLGLSPFLSKGTIISIRSLGGCSFLSKGTIISIRSLGRLLSPLNGHDYFYSFPWEAALSSQWARLFLFVPLKGCSLLSKGTIISIRSLWRLLSPLNGHDYFYSFP